jgi:hypothetical protein
MAADCEKNPIPSNQDEIVSDGSDMFDALAAFGPRGQLTRQTGNNMRLFTFTPI